MVHDMRLETDRLLIRPYLPEDLEECFALMQDKDLFHFLDMDVMTFEEYSGLFHWLIDCYKVGFDRDFKYSFNIILKESGTHIGWCGIGGAEFDHSRKEIYYLIGRAYWGNGYAKEAAKALLAFAFNTIGLQEVIAVVKPDNVASRKVIESLGLNFQHIITGLPDEHNFYNGERYYTLAKTEYDKKAVE